MATNYVIVIYVKTACVSCVFIFLIVKNNGGYASTCLLKNKVWWKHGIKVVKSIHKYEKINAHSPNVHNDRRVSFIYADLNIYSTNLMCFFSQFSRITHTIWTIQIKRLRNAYARALWCNIKLGTFFLIWICTVSNALKMKSWT